MIKLTKIRKRRQVEQLLVIGSAARLYFTFNICNLEVEKIAGPMKERSWSFNILPCPDMADITLVKPDNKEIHHYPSIHPSKCLTFE